MIAYASRYGHQDLLTRMGAVTVARLRSFNDALLYWIRIEKDTKDPFADGG